MPHREKKSKKSKSVLSFAAEKALMTDAISNVLKQKEFASLEEAQAFLGQFVGMEMSEIISKVGGESGGEASKQKADELFFEAIDADDVKTTRRGLREVLRLDPDHVRARTAIAFMEKSPIKVEKGLREAIAIGERQLGKLLEESRGSLWGRVEARPYLEARLGLAEFLGGWEERMGEAISEYQELLDLNAVDNQGARFELLGLLLEERRFEEAERLIATYDGDDTAAWAYGKAFLAFQAAVRESNFDPSGSDREWLANRWQSVGDFEALPESTFGAANTALLLAFSNNPWCAGYLLEQQKFLKEELPESHAPGSRGEARVFLKTQGIAWTKDISAHLWLAQTFVGFLKDDGSDDHFTN